MSWQNYFTDIILERGLDYYKDNRVKITSQSSSKVKARVIGYHNYNISINLETKECYCDCRYGGRCKHIAATFYYLDEHPKSNNDYSDLLSNFSYEELVTFLEAKLPQNHELLDKLKAFKKQDMDDEYYRVKLNKSFKSPVNVIDFINEELMSLNNINLKLSLMNHIMDYLDYFSDSKQLTVTLMNNDKAISSKVLKITLNGVTYTRTTDDKGQASLGLNLKSGNYTSLVESEEYSISTLVNIKVKPTVYSYDLVKVFKNGTQFYALFLDSTGKVLIDTDVQFNINGVIYTRPTNKTGWAKLNINLKEDSYIITARNPVTNESGSSTITVLSLIESSDLIKYYKNESQYVVRIRSADGSWVKSGEKVTFNINGVIYTRITNETGYAKLNINLCPGEYIITAGYNDCAKSNSILIMPVLTGTELNMKYKDGSKFTAKLVDGQGKAYSGQTVTFNVNGIFYNRVTDANGTAKLNINLQPGKYIITSSFNGASTSDKITVSS